MKWCLLLCLALVLGTPTQKRSRQESEKSRAQELESESLAHRFELELSLIRKARQLDVDDLVKLLRDVRQTSEKNQAKEFRDAASKAIVELGLRLARCTNDVHVLTEERRIDQDVASHELGGKHLKQVFASLDKLQDDLDAQIKKAREALK